MHNGLISTTIFDVVNCFLSSTEKLAKIYWFPNKEIPVKAHISCMFYPHVLLADM